MIVLGIVVSYKTGAVVCCGQVCPEVSASLYTSLGVYFVEVNDSPYLLSFCTEWVRYKVGESSNQLRAVCLYVSLPDTPSLST